MKSYKEHLVSTKSTGEEVNLKRRPVYRGSAIFTVLCNTMLETRVLFMGYWMVKKGIKELGLLITLRDQKGKIVVRKSSQITSTSAQEIYIKNLLSESRYREDNEFVGSVELEIFSSRDLVFPYPAFVVNYFNQYGSSFVHTTGRIYNDIEDLRSNESKVKECGFDVFPGFRMEPFITFVNGHNEYESAQLELEIITGKNTTYSKAINLGHIEPLETVVVRFKDYLPIDEYLEGMIGTIKISHNFTGFFPRFIAGNFDSTVGAAAITHTYYDNSDNALESAYWKNEAPSMAYDSCVYVPLFIEDEWYTQLKLYPIYSPSEHIININFFDQFGRTIGKLNDFKFVERGFNEFVEVDFGSLINELSLSREEVKGAMLIKEWKDKAEIPTRLKYGLNVGRRGLKFDMPTNICFASHVSNIKLTQKKGTFKWFPMLNHGGSVAVVENSSFLRHYEQVANLEVTFYREDEEVIVRNHEIPPNGQLRISMDEEIMKFANEKSIWITVKSDSPFVKAWYFEFNKSGIMGGDHSF